MPDGLNAGRDSVFLEAPEADGKGVEGSAEGLPRADCRPDGFAPLSSEPVDDPNFQLLRGARALVGPRLFSWGCNMHLVQSLVLTQIRPNPRNARTHSKKQIAQIAASIKTFGFTVPVLVNEGHVLLAGHGRLEAARMPNAGHVTSQSHHREFAMAGGEMSRDEFTKFIRDWMTAAAAHLLDGGLLATFIDWRSIDLVLACGRELGFQLLNIVVWPTRSFLPRRQDRPGDRAGRWRDRRAARRTSLRLQAQPRRNGAQHHKGVSGVARRSFRTELQSGDARRSSSRLPRCFISLRTRPANGSRSTPSFDRFKVRRKFENSKMRIT